MKLLKTYKQLFEKEYNVYSALLNNDVEFLKNYISKNNNNTIGNLLCSAASNGKEPVIKVLIENGADVNFIDGNGWTPLLYAAYNDNINSVLILLGEKNINPYYIERSGKMFFDYLDDKDKSIIKEKFPEIYKKILIFKKANEFNL